MTLPKENLDNKAFEDLLKEAISRIPVYAPGWTDHNIHDPGITFIELFAWLTEMQIYRLNRINDKNYRKFLKLIGIPKLKPASAAKVDVTFSLKPGFTQVDVPKGTTLVATDPSTGEDILFETEQDLKVVNIKNKEITVLSQKAKSAESDTNEGEDYIKNTDANRNDNLYYYAFRPEEQPKVDDELYIGFKDDPGTEIVLAFYLQDNEPIKDEENSAVIPLGRLDWYYYGTNDALNTNSWRKIKDGEINDETRHFSVSGKVRIKITSKLEKKDIGENKGFFWVKCSVTDEKDYYIPPKIDRVLLNTVSAVNAIPYNEVKFSSNGLPYFYIDLENVPVLDTTAPDKRLAINRETWTKVEDFRVSGPEDRHYTVNFASGRVTFGNGINGKIPPKGMDNITVSYFSTKVYGTHNNQVKFSSSGLPGFYIDLKNALVLDEKPDKNLTVNVNEWIEVEDFDASKPEDRHYTVNFASGRVTFGNGINGKIPPKGKDNITVSYYSGGGLRGNVKANSIARILNESLDKKVTATNNEAASGGTEAETLEEAIQRARNELKTVRRAVTSADYEYLTLNTPGLRVTRAKALPKYHPNKDREVPGIISIIVVPESPSNNPIPSPNFLKAVYRHLDEHRLLTTELFVLPPVYVEVSIKAKVVIKPKNVEENVVKEVKSRLKKFLHPVSGGFDGKGWPFGRSVYISEIYELIDGIEGVNYVESLTLSGKRKKDKEFFDIPLTATRSISIPAEGLVYLDLVETEIVAKEETDVFGV